MKLLPVAATLLSMCVTSLAQATGYNSSVPQVYALGLMGNKSSQLSGQIEVFMPFARTSHGLIFTDLQLLAGKDSSWRLGFGAGGRRILTSTQLGGGYIYFDRIKSQNDFHHWFTTPGLESISIQKNNIFQARVNALIPLTAKYQTLGKNVTGTQAGLTGTVSFENRNQYDWLFTRMEKIGPGVEIQISNTFKKFHNFTTHLGAYNFFSIPDRKGITGASVWLDLPINRSLIFTLRDSYDRNKGNTLMVGFEITTNNENAYSTNIWDHLSDPIHRYIGSLDSANSLSLDSSFYQNHGYINTGVLQVTQSHIYFFSSTGSLLSSSAIIDNNTCTYQNPCAASSFDQTVLDRLNTNSSSVANFYFAPATYFADPLTVYTNQSFYGRSADFSVPSFQSSGAVETFEGALVLQGNNTIQGISLVNDYLVEPSAIIINANAGNIVLDNLSIGNSSTPAFNYINSLACTNCSGVSLTNSTIFAYSNVYNIPASNFLLSGTNTIALSNNIFTSTSLSSDSYGIQATSSSVTNLTSTNNTYNVNATTSGFNAVGINLNNSQLTINELGTSTFTLAGYLATGISSNGGIDQLTLSNTNFTVNGAGGNATGISKLQAGTLNLTGASLNFSMASQGSGVISGVNTQNSTINILGTSALANELITFTSTANSSSGTSSAYGINMLTGTNVIQLQNTAFNVLGNYAGQKTAGISLTSTTLGSSITSLSNASFNIISLASGTQPTGVYVGGTSSISLIGNSDALNFAIYGVQENATLGTYSGSAYSLGINVDSTGVATSSLAPANNQVSLDNVTFLINGQISTGIVIGEQDVISGSTLAAPTNYSGLNLTLANTNFTIASYSGNTPYIFFVYADTADVTLNASGGNNTFKMGIPTISNIAFGRAYNRASNANDRNYTFTGFFSGLSNCVSTSSTIWNNSTTQYIVTQPNIANAQTAPINNNQIIFDSTRYIATP